MIVPSADRPSGPDVPGGTVLDLAPEICRQRLVVEGLNAEPISAEAISGYLTALSTAIDMVTLIEPVTHRSPQYGWAGWIHWETSGAHFYAWDVPRLFFSVDIYACKPFSADAVLDLTKRWFDATELVHKGF
jgi:S-adenosylmethionine decarboxylase